MDIRFVLVTGATGFIGAHIVDALLARGIRVRGATRTLAKGETMLQARQQYAHLLEFTQIEDFENPGGLVGAVKDVDAIIHTASVRHFPVSIYNLHTDALISPSPLRTTQLITRRSLYVPLLMA